MYIGVPDKLLSKAQDLLREYMSSNQTRASEISQLLSEICETEIKIKCHICDREILRSKDFICRNCTRRG